MFRKSKAPKGFKNAGKVKEWKEDGVSATEVSFEHVPRLSFKRVGEIDDDEEKDDRRHENEFEGLSDDDKLPAKASKLVTDGISSLGKGAGNILSGMRNYRGDIDSDEDETKRHSRKGKTDSRDIDTSSRKHRRSDDKDEGSTRGGLRTIVDTTTSYITSMRQPQADAIQKALKEGKRVDPETGKVLGNEIISKAKNAGRVMETVQSYIGMGNTEGINDKSGKSGVLGSFTAITGWGKTNGENSDSEDEGHDDFIEDTVIPKKPSEERREKAEAKRKTLRQSERKGNESRRQKRVTKLDEADRPVTFVEGMTNVFNWALSRGAFDPKLQEELARRAKTQRLPVDVDRAATLMNKTSHSTTSKLVTKGGDPRRNVVNRGDSDWNNEEDSGKGEWFFQRVFRSRSTPAESRQSDSVQKEGGSKKSKTRVEDGDDKPSERGRRSHRSQGTSDKGKDRKIRKSQEEKNGSDEDNEIGTRKSRGSDRYDPNQDWDDHQDLENAWFFQRWAKNARHSSQKNKHRRGVVATNSGLGTDTTLGAHAYKGRAREGEPDPGVFQSVINKVKDSAEQYAEEKINQVVDAVARATEPKKGSGRREGRQVDRDLDSDWDSQSDDGGNRNKPTSLYDRFVEATGAALGVSNNKETNTDSDTDSDSVVRGKSNSSKKTEKTWLGENYFSEYLNGAGASWLLEKVNPMNVWNGSSATDSAKNGKGGKNRRPEKEGKRDPISESSDEEFTSDRGAEESKRKSLKSKLRTPRAISRLAEDIGISRVKSRLADDSKKFETMKMAGKTMGNAAGQNRLVRGVKQFKEKKTLFKAAALRMLDDMEVDKPKARTKAEAKEKMESIAQRFKEDMMSDKLQMAKERLKLGKARPKS